MYEFLQRLSRTDFDTALHNLLEFFDGADPCFLGLVVGVLVFLGSRMVAGQPGSQSWGLRLAASALLIYGGYLWFTGKLEDGTPMWRHGVRCGSVAGIVLAVAWIVLPVLSFVHRRIRLALAVFLCYVGYAALSAKEATSEQLSAASLHGLAITGLALIVAWIVDPFWTPLARQLFPGRASDKSAEETGPASVPMAVRPAMMTPAPVVLPNLETAGEAQRRRDRVRMQLELAYLQAMPAINSWMPRTMFDDFLRRHLGDHLPAMDVEDHARQLLAVLKQHQEQLLEGAGFASLDELAGWLVSEQHRIQEMTLEQPLKQTQLLDLHRRYLLLATRMVQKQPALPC